VTVTSDTCDAGLHGELQVVVPEGWQAEPARSSFELAPGAYCRVAVRFRPPPQARPGRYFIAVRVTGDAGPAQEDVVTVDLVPWDPLGPYAKAAGDGPPATGLSGFRHPGNEAAKEIEARISPQPLVVAAGDRATLELTIANRAASALWGEAQLISPVETWPFTGPWSQAFRVEPGDRATVPFKAEAPAYAGTLSSWLLVKVMYFGRLWYSPSVRFEVVPPGQPPTSGP